MLSSSIPGLYFTEQQYALNPLRIDTRCLTGFVGITERGPIDTPVLISSFDEYIKIFGSFDTAGHLPFSVYSYFKCGGAECVIVRIADIANARKASLELPCDSGNVSLEAKTEGIWGNNISVRVWHEGETLEGITQVDREEGKWLELADKGIEINDVVKISLFGQQCYRTIERKEEEKVFFDSPLELLQKIQNVNEDMKAERAFVSFSLSCKGKTENHLHLSMNSSSDRYYLAYINQRSQFCTIGAGNVKGIIKPFYAKNANGGNDGIAEISKKDYIGYYEGLTHFRGLGALESRDDISLIAMPDVQWLLSQAGKNREEREEDVYTVQAAMINQAERFPNRFAILDVPGSYEGPKVLGWAKRIDSSSAAAYYPYIDIIDPVDRTGSKTVRVPPSGAICGCIVATDNEKGIFHAPANITLQGAVGLSAHIDDSEYELLYPAGVNMLKYFPGRGVKIWGARTLTSNPDWRYINVRRTFTTICKSLKQGTQWAVFESNDKNLRKRLVRQVSGFLLDLWMNGYLAGSTAEQGFYVRCDEELNPPENIDNGILTFEVGLAITKPTEFFKISITAEKEGASIYIEEN